MFADLSSDSDWSGHSHRGWTTLISFALQALAVGCLLLLPLLYNEGLPKQVLLVPFLTPVPPPAAPPEPPRHSLSSRAQSNMMGTMLVTPHEIPHDVNMLTENGAATSHDRSRRRRRAPRIRRGSWPGGP
jgi:hypothetical protein